MPIPGVENCNINHSLPFGFRIYAYTVHSQFIGDVVRITPHSTPLVPVAKCRSLFHKEWFVPIVQAV